MFIDMGSAGSNFGPASRRLVIQPLSDDTLPRDRSGKGHAVTITGATLSNTTPVTGTDSVSFTGASSHVITAKHPSVLAGDFFTIGAGVSAFMEVFFYFPTLQNAKVFIAGAQALSFISVGVNASNVPIIWTGHAAGNEQTFGSAVSGTTWHHAIVDIRQGGGSDTKVYLDGTLGYTKSSDPHAYSASQFQLGGDWGALGFFTGLAQARLVVGASHPDPTASAPTTPWEAASDPAAP